MTAEFFAATILNSPYAPPARHWELDETGQPTFMNVYAMEAEFIATLDAAVNALLEPTVEVVHA